MAKKPFVPLISAGLLGKTPKAQKQHVAKRIKDHFKSDLPLHFYVPRTKKAVAQGIAALVVSDDIEVLVTEIVQLDDKLSLMVEAVGLKKDDVIITNQQIHIPDGTKRQWVNEDDGITYEIDNLVEDPEEAFFESIRRAVARWEATA